MFKKFRITNVVICSILIVFSYVVQASQFDAELLRLTNIERQNAGLSALTLSSQLGQAAQNHAEDMANNNYFSHTGLNSSRPSERAEAAGYNYSYVGENISAGRTTPSETINGWMNSTGHRENILNSNYTEIGFGYAYSDHSDYNRYWVQVFGKPTGGSISTPQPVQIINTSDEFKSNAIFNVVEQDYAAFFSPKSVTQTINTDDGIIYYRFYYNSYQAGLATYQGNLLYSFHDEWELFGTLEEANQLLCNGQCWTNVMSGDSSITTSKRTTSTERIAKTGKTFVDSQTGLEWVDDDIRNKERNEAIAYCNSLDYDGHNDWRLSTSDELATFVKALDQSPVRPDYLGSFSTCSAGITTDGYIALLDSEYALFGEPIGFRGHASVRCVR